MVGMGVGVGVGERELAEEGRFSKEVGREFCGVCLVLCGVVVGLARSEL